MFYDRGHQAGPLQFIKNDTLLSFQAIGNISLTFFEEFWAPYVRKMIGKAGLSCFYVFRNSFRSGNIMKTEYRITFKKCLRCLLDLKISKYSAFEGWCFKISHFFSLAFSK